MSIKLESQQHITYIKDLISLTPEITFHDVIKKVEKEHPLPKFKDADNTFYEHWLDEETIEKIKDYDSACLLRDLLIKALAEEFVEMHAREAEAPDSRSWIIPVNELDFSLESLKKIDAKNDYSNAFKQKYCTTEILPLVTGYVLHSILKNTVQQGWKVHYADNIYQLVLKPSAGKKEILPADYIKICLFSGFKYTELYACLQANTKGLSEIYGVWRRQYLSDMVFS